MVKKLIISIIAGFTILISFAQGTPAHDIDNPVTKIYPDITLPSSTHLTDLWDLNKGPVTVSYTLDLSSAPNVDYDWNWNNAGIVGLFSGGSGAQMYGYLADWDNRASQFPSYPDKPSTQDMDDKFNLQRFPNPGAYDETMYDVLYSSSGVPSIQSSSFGSGNNYGVWFDRDGVDQWQANNWGMINGATYNTNGIYDVSLKFEKYSDSKGVVCACFFPNNQGGVKTGFYTSWLNGPPQKYPAGLSFASDVTRMGSMQVTVGGAPSVGTITVKNLTVTGYLANRSPVIQSVSVSPNQIWPPNKKPVDVTLTVAATDPDGSCDIVRTTYSVSDEYGKYNVNETDLPANGIISLVADRDGKDLDGRVYTINIKVYDAHGLSSTQTATVVVPHDQRK